MTHRTLPALLVLAALGTSTAGCKGAKRAGAAARSASAAPAAPRATPAAGHGAARAGSGSAAARAPQLANPHDNVRLEAKVVASTAIYSGVCGLKTRYDSFDAAMAAAQKAKGAGRRLVADLAALQKKPDEPRALHGVVLAAYGAGDYRRAWRSAQRLLKRPAATPRQRADALYTAARVERRLGKLVAAQRTARRAIDALGRLPKAAAAARKLAAAKHMQAELARAIAAWTEHPPSAAPERGPTIGLPLPWAAHAKRLGKGERNACHGAGGQANLCACLKKQLADIEPKSCATRKKPSAANGALRVLRVFGNKGFADAVIEKHADGTTSALLAHTVSTVDESTDKHVDAYGGIKVLRSVAVGDQQVVWVEHERVTHTARGRRLDLCNRAAKATAAPLTCHFVGWVIDFDKQGGRAGDTVTCSVQRAQLFDDGTLALSALHGSAKRELTLLLPAARVAPRAPPAATPKPRRTPSPATYATPPPPLSFAPIDLATFKRAYKLNWRGLRLLKRKKYKQAAVRFIDALRADPGHVYARYNLGGTYALLGNAAAALKMLEQLDRSGCPMCMRRLRAAAADHDYASLHANPRFAKLTAHVKVVEPDYKAATAALIKGLRDGSDPLIETVKHYRMLRYEFSGAGTTEKGIAWRASQVRSLIGKVQPAKHIACAKGSTCCTIESGHDSSLSGPASTVYEVQRVCFWAESPTLALPIRIEGAITQPEG